MPSSACDWSSDVCSSDRSEEHTSELQSRSDLVCRLLLEKKNHTSPHAARRKKQLRLPLVPTHTISSFPHTAEVPHSAPKLPEGQCTAGAYHPFIAQGSPH